MTVATLDFERVRQLELDARTCATERVDVSRRLDRIEAILVAIAGTTITTLLGGLGCVAWYVVTHHP